MKQSSICPMDTVGRIVIPKQIRKRIGIDGIANMEVSTDHAGNIILRRVQKACVFCGSEVDVVSVLGKGLCCRCQSKITKAVED